MTPERARDASHAALLAAERDARLVAAHLFAPFRTAGARAAEHPHGATQALELAHHLERSLTGLLGQVRAAGRAQARRTLGGELHAIGLHAVLPAAPGGQHSDLVRAAADAKAFAGAWLGSLVAKTSAPPPKGDDDAPGAIVAAPTKAGATRAIEVTAAASVASAFADEREEAGAAYARRAEAHGLVVPLKQWSALLDACPRCRRLDGKTRPLGVDFPGGFVPGLVHRSCRCVMSVVILSGATMDDEEIAA